MIDKLTKQGILQSFSSVDSLYWKHSKGIVISNDVSNTNSSQYEWIRQINYHNVFYLESIKKGETSDLSKQVLLGARSLIDETYNSKYAKDFMPLFELRNEKSEQHILLSAFPILLYCDSNISVELNRLLDTISDLDLVISTRLYIMAMHRVLNIKKNLEYGFLLDFLLADKVLDSIFNFSSQNPTNAKYFEEAKIKFIELVNRIKSNLHSGPIDIYSSTLNMINKTNNLGRSTRDVLAIIYTFSKYISNPLSGIEKLGKSEHFEVSLLCPLLGSLYGALDSGAWLPINWQTTEDSEYINALSEDKLKKPIFNKVSFIEKVVLSLLSLNPRKKYLLTKSHYEARFGGLTLLDKTTLVSVSNKKLTRRKYADINRKIFYIYG